MLVGDDIAELTVPDRRERGISPTEGQYHSIIMPAEDADSPPELQADGRVIPLYRFQTFPQHNHLSYSQ